MPLSPHLLATWLHYHQLYEGVSILGQWSLSEGTTQRCALSSAAHHISTCLHLCLNLKTQMTIDECWQLVSIPTVHSLAGIIRMAFLKQCSYSCTQKVFHSLPHRHSAGFTMPNHSHLLIRSNFTMPNTLSVTKIASSKHSTNSWFNQCKMFFFGKTGMAVE